MGRIAIVVLPIIGMLPLLSDPTALDATTTSGTGLPSHGFSPPLTQLCLRCSRSAAARCTGSFDVLIRTQYCKPGQ